MATGNFTAVEAEGLKDIECVICLEPWDKPVELEPCRHVFCERCAAPLRQCPECRANIAGRKQPNRILVNLAESAVVKCETCQWTGTREQSRTHRCGDQPQGSAPQAAAAQPSRPQTWQPPAHSTQNPTAVPQPNIPPPQPSCAPSSSQAQRQLQQQQQPHPGAAVGGPPGPWTEYGLTQDEYDHIMTVFLTFDADDSGELDRREVTTLCRWLNYAHGERDIDAMFRAMDTDRSGALSMDEFCRWISTHRPDPQALYGLSHEEYENTLFAFHSYDRDQNGILNRQEFGQLAMRQGWARSAPEADQLFNSIDTDRNNGVDLDEILRFRHRAKTGSAFSGPAPAGGTPGYGAQPSTPAPMWQAQGGAWQQQQQQQQPPQQGQWQQAGPGWQAQGGPGWSQSQSQSQGWQQPLQQQQQQHYGQYPSQQAPRPRTLEGRVVEVTLGNAFRGVPVFVTVAPGAQAPQLFRTEPASGSDGRAAFNADFVVPVHNPQDNAVVRVFRASDGEELCGTMVRLSDVPPGNTAPRDEWFPLHARDANRFNAAGCRVHLRLSMIG